MSLSFKNILVAITIGITTNFIASPVCTADVVVFDRVTTVNTPVRITVLTKGRFFSEGGRLVDLYLEEKHLKRILTGGDGYGYYKITPRSPGFLKITARSNSDSAEGLLLVMTPKDRAIAIEVEQGFKQAVFSEEIKQSSLKAVKSLGNKYKIIYLTRIVGKSITAGWLDKQGYPESVILVWRGASTLKSMKKKGVIVEAIIGSATVVSEVAGVIENRYCFEKTKNATMVKSWDEILKDLQENEAPRSPPEADGVSKRNCAEAKPTFALTGNGGVQLALHPCGKQQGIWEKANK